MMMNDNIRILRLMSRGGCHPLSLYHVVNVKTKTALCGKRPYSGSQWFPIPGDATTCPACSRRVERGDTHE